MSSARLRNSIGNQDVFVLPLKLLSDIATLELLLLRPNQLLLDLGIVFTESALKSVIGLCNIKIDPGFAPLRRLAKELLLLGVEVVGVEREVDSSSVAML